LHYSYQLGIGPTLEGAALLARSGIRVVMSSTAALQLRIRNLPLALLSLEPVIAGALHTAGVRTIGLLLELPRGAVNKRFGVQLGNFLDRLVGTVADPRPVFRLPARYDARFDFEFEVKSTEALLFPLRRMLHEFAGFLRARDTGVQRFTITFAHRGATNTSVDIGLSLADRDANLFLTLVRERLEHLELPAPTIGLGLAADQFAMPAALQADLAHGSLQQNEELAIRSTGSQHVSARSTFTDCDRLRIIGPKRAGRRRRCKPRAKLRNFPSDRSGSCRNPSRCSCRSCRRSCRVPSASRRLVGHRDVQRDYYVVHLSNGSSLWVYQDLGERGGWYLHGFWS
jgi:protein ImuB